MFRNSAYTGDVLLGTGSVRKNFANAATGTFVAAPARGNPASLRALQLITAAYRTRRWHAEAAGVVLHRGAPDSCTVTVPLPCGTVLPGDRSDTSPLVISY